LLSKEIFGFTEKKVGGAKRYLPSFRVKNFAIAMAESFSD
jgi:hypothetical protein